MYGYTEYLNKFDVNDRYRFYHNVLNDYYDDIIRIIKLTQKDIYDYITNNGLTNKYSFSDITREYFSTSKKYSLVKDDIFTVLNEVSEYYWTYTPPSEITPKELIKYLYEQEEENNKLLSDDFETMIKAVVIGNSL